MMVLIRVLLSSLTKRKARLGVAMIAYSMAASVCISPAVAVPILDQSNLYPDSGGISTFTVYETENVLAQTFTAGLSGRLVAVDLGLVDRRASEDLTISIFHTLAGLPDLSGAPLATGALTPADVDLDSFSLETVDLSASNFDVVLAEMYAIVLSSPTPFRREYDWTHGSFDGFTGDRSAPLDPYAGGVGYFSDDGGATWSSLADGSGLGSQDFSFRTIVDPSPISGPGSLVPNTSPIPEPGSLVLMATGIACLALLRRRLH